VAFSQTKNECIKEIFLHKSRTRVFHRLPTNRYVSSAFAVDDSASRERRGAAHVEQIRD
jgi:hypothetical protein